MEDGGNALAVALEMQKYKGALFILEHALDFEINLESVSSEFGGTNVWNAKETFELSQMGYIESKLGIDTLCEEFPELAQMEYNNVLAAIQLQKIFEEKSRGQK